MQTMVLAAWPCRLAMLLLILGIIYLFSFERARFSFPQRGPTHAHTGRWEPSIQVPLVATAVALLPVSGRVVLWAADRGATFGSDPTELGRTVAAIFDPIAGSVSQLIVSSINHTMFCPGLSLDTTGHPIVTGGSSSDRTSIYDETIGSWIAGPAMTSGRGYHAQTTISDGRVFTIGGSWSGRVGGKDGEIFDPPTNTWYRLPGCIALPALTNDQGGSFYSDNHAWLFAWKGGSVFQAGPSMAMNWYGTAGSGSQASAGLRANDQDSMNGNAVMYDATNGKILTLGGSTSYTSSFGTSDAHIITLTEPFTPPTVETIEPMSYRRVFANSVVLPTGDVFVNGGNSWATQWTDVNASWVPELWSPRTRSFTSLKRMPIARAYHSVAVLLPDATVLTGGGGLCWIACADPSANHFDIQIFTPPYLFNRGGNSLATRPRILEVSESTVTAGTSLVILTDMEINDFALVRHGSATHSINTDQRRIALPPTRIDGTTMKYQVKVPADTGIALPGYWMLFAINDNGVPSIANKILIIQSSYEAL
jgi:galactose oxidase